MRYLLLDGYNLAFRCYYAVPELSRSDGMPTNALHGWIRTLWKLQDDYKPDALYVFFDLGGSQRRLALHPEYKANRLEAPESFRVQVPVMKAMANIMGISVIEENGVEADDMLAAVAVKLAGEGHETYMVSADKDLAQAIRPGVKQLLPPPTANPRLGWRELDGEGVNAKYGLPPELIVDYLSLIGDTSDNIPGLNGVGPKTALKWLLEYGSLEGIIKKQLYLKPARFQVKVAKEAERLRLNYELISLELDLEVLLPERGELVVDDIVQILEEYELKKHAQDALKRYSS